MQKALNWLFSFLYSIPACLSLLPFLTKEVMCVPKVKADSVDQPMLAGQSPISGGQAT
jgi:hypothetical protein